VSGAGGKTWFTAAELADLALPGLPKSKRKVNERASDEGWALKADGAGMPLARPRVGVRGGAIEYHIGVIPAASRLELVKRGIAIGESAANPSAEPSCQWRWFEAQSAATKNEAHRRAALVGLIERNERIGLTRTAAIATVSAEHGVGASTLWGWLTLIDGCDPNNRLPLLAPRRAGGGAEADIDGEVWTFFLSDYLRPEKPTVQACHRRAEAFAQSRGIQIPSYRTFDRRLKRMDQRPIILKREGEESLRRMLPPQKRTVADLHAMALVNIDGHKFDVFVRFPDGRIGRPMMVAIQDIYSRKMLAWRIGETENAVLTRLAFADLFQKWGIPKGCLLDNGRAFASKWITGGAPTRFRFKIREEEPTGLLTALGVQIHWAQPYRGQSKPIERAFRDLTEVIARHPATAGAYTGNSPMAKPDNYGDRAVDLADFTRIVANGIAAHNARTGRRTEMARLGSFDSTFEESYRTAPIGKATPEQLRMALLTADEVSVGRQSGAIENFYGNRYWSAELAQLAGKRVTVRFDPDNLLSDLHVYSRDGRYLCAAPVWEATGFLDVAAAKRRAKQESDWKKAARNAAELEDLMTAEQLVAMLPDFSDEGDVPTPSVVRPVRHHGQTAAALRPAADPGRQPNPQFIARFTKLRVVG
jgi:putative transposase